MFFNIGMHIRNIPHREESFATRHLLCWEIHEWFVGESKMMSDGGQKHLNADQEILQVGLKIVSYR